MRAQEFAARRQALAAEATSGLAELGFARASMRELAQHCAISLGVLHYYFDDKDNLVMCRVRQRNRFCAKRFRGSSRIVPPNRVPVGIVPQSNSGAYRGRRSRSVLGAMSVEVLLRNVESMTHAHVPTPAEMMRNWLRHSAQQIADAILATRVRVQRRTHWPQHTADYYPPRREESFEEAAMAREMYRL